MQDSITKSYKRSKFTLVNNINKGTKTVAAELKLDNTIEKLNHREVFVILKDHKVNFQNNLKCRLINPAKTGIRMISKHYLEFINKKKQGKNINEPTTQQQFGYRMG